MTDLTSAQALAQSEVAIDELIAAYRRLRREFEGEPEMVVAFGSYVEELAEGKVDTLAALIAVLVARAAREGNPV